MGRVLGGNVGLLDEWERVMSEFKEVWYVWDGKTRIPHVENLAYKIDGNYEVIENWNYAAALGDKKSDCNVIAYTLGQKRRRVECGKCEDGVVTIQHKCGFFRRVYCHRCKGTGKTWEYAE